ncbi:MAG: class I SAM-dependent methyltransferase [Anaerolineae bacterium]
MTHQIQRTYTRDYHKAHLTESPVRSVVWRVICQFLAPYIPPDAHVLEIGAGYCHWINSVTAARKTAIDLWEKMPEYAAPDVETIQHDLTHGLACLNDRTFDTVLASNVLEHFEPDRALKLTQEIYARLRTGGRLIVIQPNFYTAYRHYFDDYTHRSIFTHVSLAAHLRASGFEIERVMPRFLPYSMQGMRFRVPAWFIRLYLKSPVKPFAGQMLVIAQKNPA